MKPKPTARLLVLTALLALLLAPARPAWAAFITNP